MNQTCDNYEVIVVDDCSTDNSVAIVRSYAEKFGERLVVTKTETNSGGCAVPRNVGLPLARGEYVFFMDADDLLIETALEQMYTLCKEYDADVVHFEKYFVISEDLKERRILGWNLSKTLDKPTFESENLAERFKTWFNDEFTVYAWVKLVKRDLLLDNELFFPHIKPAEDTIWTYALFFYAKKFLRAPNPVYIYRLTANSIMRKERTPQEAIVFRMNSLFGGLKALDKITSKLEFFQENPKYRYALLEKFINGRFACTFQDSSKLPPFAIYEALKQAFDELFGEQDILISALCTYAYTLQKINAGHVLQFNQFAAQAQRRINELNNYAFQAQQRISELEAQLKTK